jgi:hypothetical protein
MVKRVLVTLLLACALAACSDDGTGPEETVIEGQWVLRTVNGDSLPYVQAVDTISQTIQSGNILVNTNGSFVFTLTVSFRVGSQTGTQTLVGTGDWDENKGAITLFYDDDSFPDAGTIVGRSLYMTLFGGAFVFRRE